MKSFNSLHNIIRVKYFVLTLTILLCQNIFSAKKTITMAFPEFAPYAHFTKGKASGICVDLVRKKIGGSYNLKFVSFPWSRAVSSLKNGEIDAVGCLGFTEERKNFSIYSDPLFSINILLLKKRGNVLKVNTVNDLKKYEGVVVRGDSSSRYFSSSNIHHVSSVKSLIKFILLDRAKLAVLPEEIYNEEMLEFTNHQKGQITTRIIEKQQIYLAISKKSKLKNEIKKINELLSR